MSDNQKMLLEKMDCEFKQLVSIYMASFREMKNGSNDTIVQAGASNIDRINKSNTRTADDCVLSFEQSIRSNRRPIACSTPLPVNQSMSNKYNQSIIDQVTQMYKLLIAKIRRMKIELDQFLEMCKKLCAFVEAHGLADVLVEPDSAEVSNPEHNETGNETAPEHPVVGLVNGQNLNKPSVDVISNNGDTSRIRVVSAHINNTGANTNEVVSIGDGHAKVPARLLREIDWTSYTAATRKLLHAVFPRRVLATHSLTGKPSPAFMDKPAKKCLDPLIVNDIVKTVSKGCNVPKRLVRSCVTIKCADESKLFRNREKLKNIRRKGHQENITLPTNIID